MNDSDHLPATFHPIAQKLFFARVQAFGAQAGRVDRSRDEQTYQSICNQHVHTLRSELEAAASQLLAQHTGTQNSGLPDFHLRQLIQEYLHKFVRRIS